METKELIALAVQLTAPQIPERKALGIRMEAEDIKELLEKAYTAVKEFSESKERPPTAGVFD